MPRIILKRSFILLLILFIFLSLVPVLIYILEFHLFDISNTTSDWGIFGDFVSGTTGTILTIFSIILIYITYQNQVENNLTQQFESSFFSLLNTQREIVNNISSKSISPKNTNDDFNSFDFFVNLENQMDTKIFKTDTFNSIYSEPYNGTNNTKKDEAFRSYLKLIEKEYANDIFKKNDHLLGHYLRHLFHLIKYIDDSNIVDKKKYTDIVQAQLSDKELVLCLVNSLSRHGIEKMKPLMQKYNFFENISSKSENFDKFKLITYPDTRFKNIHWCAHPLSNTV